MTSEDNTQLQVAQMVKAMQENLPALQDMPRLNCQLMWLRYNSLLGHGSTPEQALVLCKI